MAVVGRGTDCDIVLSHAAVPGLLSRKHARLVLESSGSLAISDLNSTNGTWLQRGGHESTAWERVVAGALRARSISK
jgi:pSer/pThr/pTyr-binding forkhead associated (FHA) protein